MFDWNSLVEKEENQMLRTPEGKLHRKLKNTHAQLYVLIQGNKRFINYDTIVRLYPVAKFDTNDNDDVNPNIRIDRDRRTAMQIVQMYNNSMYSLGQKVIKAKLRYVDKWYDTLKYQQVV